MQSVELFSVCKQAPMQQVDLTCPNCLGRVMPYGDGTYGTCEYCGSVFKLDAGAAVRCKGDEEERAFCEEEGAL
jgi:hypothetical protein